MSGIGSLVGASQYDLLLAAVPVALLIGFVLTAVGPAAPTTGVGTGATLAAALVGYALFVSPPGRGGNGGRRRGPGSSGSGSGSPGV